MILEQEIIINRVIKNEDYEFRVSVRTEVEVDGADAKFNRKLQQWITPDIGSTNIIDVVLLEGPPHLWNGLKDSEKRKIEFEAQEEAKQSSESCYFNDFDDYEDVLSLVR